MTFYTYMMKTHKGKLSHGNGLAGDMYEDRASFPRNKGYSDKERQKLLDYLHEQHAIDACIESFELCWEEYVQHEKAEEEKKAYKNE